MAYGSPVIVRGKTLLNPFLVFLQRLSLDIEKEQFLSMKFLLESEIPLGILEKCESARELFSRMQQKCLLGEENLDLLEQLMMNVERTDLAKRVQVFKESKLKEEVVDATGEQLHSELPAQGKVVVYFEISGKVSDLKERTTIERMKDCLSNSLGTKRSDVCFIGREGDRESSCFFAIFQIPKDEKLLDALCKDAVSKKEWLRTYNIMSVEIEGRAVILTNNYPATCSQARQRRSRKRSTSTPQLQRGESIAATPIFFDEKKIDLIVVVECTSINTQLKTLRTQLIHLVDMISKKDYNLQMAFVSYKDHARAMFSWRNGSAKIAHTVGFTVEKDLMKTWIKGLKGQGRGPTRGLADGLKEALNLTQDWNSMGQHKCRPDGIKICLLFPVLYQESPEIYRCGHGNDVMEVCGMLAQNGVTLYTVGITPSRTSHPVGADMFADFFVGISHKTGGLFIQTTNVKGVPEIAMHAIEENVTVERLIGTTNDIVLEEVSKKYGDVNIEQLTPIIQEALNARSCRTSQLLLNGTSIGPPSPLAKKLSWDTNINDACETFQRALKKTQQSVPVAGIPADVDMEDGESVEVSLLKDQRISSEVSERMVRKVTQRSAYYKRV